MTIRRPTHRISTRRQVETAPLRSGRVTPSTRPEHLAGASAQSLAPKAKEPGWTPALAEAPATPLDRCPDCARPATDRWCADCGREVDGRASTLADRTARHLRRLAEIGLDTKRHGRWCITRATGGWAVLEHNRDTRQVCPCCRREEYRGSYCSGCGIPTGAGDWHSTPMSPERLAALASGRQRSFHPGGNGPSCVDKPEDEQLAIPAF
jgi:hypothetical protein